MALSLALVPLASCVAGTTASYGAADAQHQFERWERRLRAKVTELHSFPSGAKGSIGDVVISFSIGADGRPSEAAIRQSSGNPLFDKAAQRTVRRLGRVGPVPTMSGKDHRVVLKLSYGEAETLTADREITEALKAERKAYSRRNLGIVTTAQVAER